MRGTELCEAGEDGAGESEESEDDALQSDIVRWLCHVWVWEAWDCSGEREREDWEAEVVRVAVARAKMWRVAMCRFH